MADGVFPQRRVQAGNSEFNALAYLVQQLVGRMNTGAIVKVVGVHTDGPTSPVGTVDVQPLVDMQDGAGNPTEHTTVFGIPYLRVQGGACAVILDPQVGDVGFCAFADRDTSRVRASGAHALPGSLRRFDLADGFYFGGWDPFAGAPTSYVLVTPTEVKVVNPSAMTLEAPTVTVDGDLVVTGSVTATGNVEGNGHSLSTHVHGGVQTGGGSTGGPIG